ncbi:F0F1 ATP synthase subunit epsilon [Jannaschia sp. W003]|uniref:F0F1 ATP synthase subunit epsilon n=1 Tax=Jannaschia sp. W003 TaxID=2867012 RepID=UPI0038FC9928
MAMRFELVSPERRLASKDVRAVRIPGADGDLAAMEGHTPVVTSLRPGVLVIETEDGGEERFAVTGGFAEIGPDSTTVLAERALPASDVTQEVYDDWVADARGQAKDAPQDTIDSATKLVEDMVAMGGHIGLDPKQPNL